jgi:hypothetical protein
LGLEVTKGLEVLSSKQDRQHPERIGIYGRAGIGKSRAALMLPKTDKWGEIIYYAADDNSELLQSIPADSRERVHVIKPRGDDHLVNFQQFCMTPWDVKFPNAKTLVVDTFSVMAFRVIQQIANKGYITREEHYQIGDPLNGGFALPSRSDYQAIDSACKGFLDMLYDKQRNKNIILVFHEDSKEISKNVFVGGPAVPGRRMLEDIPASLNTVVRLIRENGIVPGKQEVVSQVVAITANNGYYIAKLREADIENGNPLGRVVLDRNPINWWNKYDAYMGGS